MRIVVINCLFPPVVSGGYEIECRQLTDMLVRWGHEVSILTSDYQAEGVEELVGYPVSRSLRLVLPFDQPARSAMRWRKWRTRVYNQRVTQRFLRQWRPDLVFLWSQLRIGMGPVRAAIDEKTPYAWRIGDLFLAGFVPPTFEMTPRGFVRYLLDSLLFRKSSLAGIDFRHSSCISESVKTNLMRLGVPLQSACVIYKGIPLETFPLRNQAGTLSTPIRILFTGRLHPEKGVHTLIEAAHLVARKLNQEIHLSLAGTGAVSYEDELHRLAAQGAAHIHFLGHVPYKAVGSIYRSHDLFVCPSIIAEGFPSTVQEAAASGLPIVCTGHGGQAERLIDQVNALLFPAGDVEALAQQMIRLIQDSALRRQLVYAARELAESTYSLEAYGRATERFLQEILRLQ